MRITLRKVSAHSDPDESEAKLSDENYVTEEYIRDITLIRDRSYRMYRHHGMLHKSHVIALPH